MEKQDMDMLNLRRDAEAGVIEGGWLNALGFGKKERGWLNGGEK